MAEENFYKKLLEIVNDTLKSTPLYGYFKENNLEYSILKKSVLIIIMDLVNKGWLKDPAVAKEKIALPVKKDEPPQINDIIKKFVELDKKKLQGALNSQEEKNWFYFHNMIMGEIYEEPFSTLLDKREFIRVPTMTLIKYKNNKGVVNTSINDISVGGLSFPFDPELDLKKPFKLILYLNNETVKIKGKILWSNKKLIALSFSEKSEKLQKQIMYFVHQELLKKLK